MTPVVGFVGMTHLGLVSAAAAAAKGCRTLAVDPDSARIAPLQQGELPVVEPGLPELIAEHRSGLRFTSDAAELGQCDLVYVAPDVPVQADGTSDTAPVDALLTWTRQAVRQDAVVVILSQVPPGFTRQRVRPGAATLCYQVETLIFGRAVERAMSPERFIVGLADPNAPLPLALAAYLALFNCRILPMRYESAELAKISINLCLVAQISITNTIADLCERNGADWAEIAPSLRLDARIGPHAYLEAGLGIGGGNLPRDIATARRLAAETGADDSVLSGFELNSRRRREWALLRLRAVLPPAPGQRIAILGLAYKPDTGETLNSPGIALATTLAGTTELRLHDPVVDARPFGDAATDPLDTCAGADAVAIMTAWPVYRYLSPAALARTMRGRLLLDPYGILDQHACRAAGLDQHVLGRPKA